MYRTASTQLLRTLTALAVIASSLGCYSRRVEPLSPDAGVEIRAGEAQIWLTNRSQLTIYGLHSDADTLRGWSRPPGFARTALAVARSEVLVFQPYRLDVGTTVGGVARGVGGMAMLVLVVRYIAGAQGMGRPFM